MRKESSPAVKFYAVSSIDILAEPGTTSHSKAVSPVQEQMGLRLLSTPERTLTVFLQQDPT
jgi:hypothetical protein